MSETVSYEAKLKSFYGTGRRKHSVARVRLYPGSGNVTINGRSIDDYFGLDTLKLIVRQPLELTETGAQFDIVCTVAGGGVTGQAGAIRHGVARALLQLLFLVPSVTSGVEGSLGAATKPSASSSDKRRTGTPSGI